MVRDILNHLGEKIGEMELPDDTTEEAWQAVLAPYAVAPPSPQQVMQQAIQRSVSESRKIADEIIEEFKAKNLTNFITNSVPNELAIMISLHVHHRLRAVSITVGGVPFVIDLLNLVISGDLETAYVVLSYMVPDDMSMPFHYLDQATINSLKLSISSRIQIA